MRAMPLAILSIAGSTLLMSGCIYAGGRTVRDVGPKITHDSTAFIEPGKTTVDWVVAAFGEPQNRVCTLDGAEVLRYDCDVRTTEGSYVLMLFASSSNKIERSSWWFEVRDQRVVRFWCDKCSPDRMAQLNLRSRATQARESSDDATTQASPSGG
jgi:hypothetical protein